MDSQNTLRPDDLIAFVEASDAIQGRASDSLRATRMAALLQPLVAFGERLGPWPGVKPASAEPDSRL